VSAFIPAFRDYLTNRMQ